jgi:transposase-like protein
MRPISGCGVAYIVDHMVDASEPRGRVDIQVGAGHRPRWSEEVKGRIVAESYAPGAVVSEVARRHDISPQHSFAWRKAARAGLLSLPAVAAPLFVPAVVPRQLSKPEQVSMSEAMQAQFSAPWPANSAARRSAHGLRHRSRHGFPAPRRSTPCRGGRSPRRNRTAPPLCRRFVVARAREVRVHKARARRSVGDVGRPQ